MFVKPRSAFVEKPSVDRKSTRLNSSHDQISYAVFCLKKKKQSHIELNSAHRDRQLSEEHIAESDQNTRPDAISGEPLLGDRFTSDAEERSGVQRRVHRDRSGCVASHNAPSPLTLVSIEGCVG